MNGPFRLRRLGRMSRHLLSHLTRRGIILTYHRIGEPDVDPWRLSVAPERFADQMEVLREQARPVTLEELVTARIDRGAKPAVAVTFDDGYANNLSVAKPVLERHGVPATVFVCSGYLEHEREYWWDELTAILLRPVCLPDELVLEISGSRRRWSLADAVEYPESQRRRDRARTDCGDRDQSPRLSFYFAMWRALQSLSDQRRKSVLDSLSEWAGYPHTVRPAYRAMTREELRALSAGGLVQVGGHTVTHPDLPALSGSMQRQEIEQGKRDLEDIVSHRVMSFAYPFGAHDSNTLNIVRESGFQIACTARHEVCWAGNSRLKMPRFNSLNWSSSDFTSLLRLFFSKNAWSSWPDRGHAPCVMDGV